MCSDWKASLLSWAIASAMASLPDSLSLVAQYQSAHWGTCNFKGCRFCRRDRNFDNPDFKKRAAKPLLQFRSERHPECLPCLGTIRKVHPIKNSTEGRNAYAKELASNEVAYETYVSEVSEYEEKVLNKERAAGPKRKIGGEDGLEVDQPKEDVNMVAEGGIEMKKFLGILWPPEVFEREEKRKPKPTEISKITVKGFNHIGVLRNRDCGEPKGSYEVYDFVRGYGQHSTQAATTDDAITAKEVEETWTKVAKGLTYDTREEPGDDQESGILAFTGAQKTRDVWDDLMDFAPVVSSAASSKGGGAGGSDGGANGSASGGGGSGGTRNTGGNKGSGGGGGGVPKVPKGTVAASRKTKEIQTSERLTLECQQAINNLASEQLVDIITTKAKHKY